MWKLYYWKKLGIKKIKYFGEIMSIDEAIKREKQYMKINKKDLWYAKSYANSLFKTKLQSR